MALDLGTLSAHMKLEGLQEYLKGLQEAEEASRKEEEAVKAGEEARKKAAQQALKQTQALNTVNSAASRLWGGVKAGAKAAIGAVSGLSASIVAMGKKSIDAYAQTEQLRGGVVKIFKDSADDVMANADKAYETAGISANNYMETATSFSASLLQSLNQDTKKAADMTDTAIKDMADNVNTYGSNMADVQNAYQGFAKQNYTMLDNLKLGYGGTQGEMERLLKDAEALNKQVGKDTDYQLGNLADMISAIHVVQKQQSITGTTEKEAAQTIEGSINSAKSAWENLLAGFADPDADLDSLTDSFTQSLDNVISNVEPAIGRITDSVDEHLPDIIDSLEPIFSDIVDLTLDTLANAGDAVIDNLPDLCGKIADTTLDLLSTAFTKNSPLAFAGLAAALLKVGTTAKGVSSEVMDLRDAFKTLNKENVATIGKKGLAGLAAGLLAATAALAISEWVKYNDTLKKTTKITTDYTSTLNKARLGIKDNTKNVMEATTAYEEWLEKQSDHVGAMADASTSYQASSYQVSNLKETIKDLAASESLSKEEVAKLNSYVDQYNKLTGSSIAKTDGSKDSLAKLTKEVTKSADAYLDAAYKKAQAKQIEIAAEGQAETQLQMEQQRKTMAQLQEQMDTAINNNNWQEYSRLSAIYDKQDQQLKTLQSANQNYKTTIDQLTTSQSLSNRATQEAVVANENAMRAVDKTTWSYTDFANKLTQYGVSAKAARNLTQEQAKAIIDLNTKMGDTKGFTKFMKSFTAAKGDITQLSTLSKDQIKELMDYVGKGKTDVNKKMSEMKSQASAKAKQTAQGVMNGVKQANGAKGYTLGQDFAQGYVNGINSKVSAAQSAGAALAAAAEEATRKKQDSHSPSKKTRKLGNYFGEGYALGIEDKLRDAEMSGGKLSQTAVDAMSRSKLALPDVEGRGYAATQAASASGGTTYNITVDDNVINDSPEIRAQIQSFIKTLARKGLM